MNTYVKALVFDRFQLNRRALSFSWSSVIMPILAIACLASAFAIIYSKDLNRRLFIQLQQAQQVQAQSQTNWGKLLLEESTWSSPARVQTIARDRLNMVMPNPSDIVLVND